MQRGFVAGSMLIVLAGCSTTGPAGSVAEPECEADSARASAVDVGDLVGTFRLILVVTSFTPEQGAEERAGWVTLRRPDSTEVAASRVEVIGHAARRDLRLVGAVDWSDGRYPAEPAELDGDTLYLGCRDCLDGSPLQLTVRDVSPVAFAGLWRDHQTGIGRVVDAESGRFLPDPAGHYCALRK